MGVIPEAAQRLSGTHARRAGGWPRGVAATRSGLDMVFMGPGVRFAKPG